MGKYEIVSTNSDGITLKKRVSVITDFVKNWFDDEPNVPAEEDDAESIFDKLATYWDNVKEKNPLRIPFSLGTGDIEEIQDEINRLTKKAKSKEQFFQEEKDFLKALYSWIAWGGLLKWYPEASKLLRHYLNGNGQRLQINEKVYKTSVIVKYAVGEIKKIICRDVNFNGTIRNNGEIPSVGTLQDLKRGGHEQNTKGTIRNGGYLLAEQENSRLKNADNQFPLESTSVIKSLNPVKIKTRWYIESIWDYDSFETQKKAKKNLVTELPLPHGKKLKLPDGLSHYLTQIGLAQKYFYFAEWTEEWGC